MHSNFSNMYRCLSHFSEVFLHTNTRAMREYTCVDTATCVCYEQLVLIWTVFQWTLSSLVSPLLANQRICIHALVAGKSAPTAPRSSVQSRSASLPSAIAVCGTFPTLSTSKIDAVVQCWCWQCNVVWYSTWNTESECLHSTHDVPLDCSGSV